MFVVWRIFDGRRMNGVRIYFVAGGIFFGRRMFEGVDRFGICHFYFDVKNIVDKVDDRRKIVVGRRGGVGDVVIFGEVDGSHANVRGKNEARGCFVGVGVDCVVIGGIASQRVFVREISVGI